MYFPKTVRMHAVDGGTAREVHYDPTLFTVDPSHVAAGLGEQPSAFAGFWVPEPLSEGSLDQVAPLAPFLRASYFPGGGGLGPVGLSPPGTAPAIGRQPVGE